MRLEAVAAGAKAERTTIASAKGRFRISLPLTVARCADVWVRAVGSAGSRAVLRRSGSCKTR